MVADPVGGNTYFKNFMNGFAEAMEIVVYQTCQGEEKTVFRLAYLWKQSFKINIKYNQLVFCYLFSINLGLRRSNKALLMLVFIWTVSAFLENRYSFGMQGVYS